MTTIRQLTAAFGFEVDTTPIARWNSAINDAKKNASGLNQIGFGGLKNSLNELGSLLNLKVLTPIGLIAASAGIAKKSFEAFADEEQATAKLRSQLQRFPGAFENISKTINKTRESTGGLISRLEGLSIASRFFEITTSPEAFNKLFDSLTKLSITRGKDVTSIIADAISTGGTEALKELGFTVQELELLTKSGREFSTVGVLQRTRLIEDLLKKAEQRINQDFKEFSLTGAASIKREQKAREELIITIGKTNDIYKRFTDSLTDAEKRLQQNIIKTDSVFLGLFKTLFIGEEPKEEDTPESRRKRLEELSEGKRIISGVNSEFFKRELENIPSKTFGIKGGIKFDAKDILKGMLDFLTNEGNKNQNIPLNGRIGNGFSSNQIEQKTEIVINSPITINGSSLTERELTSAIRNANSQIYGQAKDMAERNRIVYGKNQK